MSDPSARCASPIENECANCGNVTFGPQPGRCGHCFEATDGSTVDYGDDGEDEYWAERDRVYTEQQAVLRELVCWCCGSRCVGPKPTCCRSCKYEMVNYYVYDCDACKQPFGSGINFDCTERYYGSSGQKLCNACLEPGEPCKKCNGPYEPDYLRDVAYSANHRDTECMKCHMKWGIYYLRD